MTEKKTFTEETLERIRSGRHSEKSAKRRKFSTALVIIDAIFIILILVYFTNRETREEYRSSIFNFEDLKFRFSIGDRIERGNYLFSLTIKSNSDKEKKLNFNKYIADLFIQYNNTTIIRKIIGENVRTLSLLPGESKTLVEVIDNYSLKEFAEKHPEYILPRKKSIIQFEKSHIPLIAKIVINSNKKLSTSVKFKYKVE